MRDASLSYRNNSVTSLDEDFWNTAFTLYTPSTDPSADTSQPSESRPVRGAHPRQKTRKADKTEADKTDTDGSKPLIPEFLQPVLRQIILAGKSMEMLQALGRLGDIVEDHQTKGKGGGFVKFESVSSGYLTMSQNILKGLR